MIKEDKGMVSTEIMIILIILILILGVIANFTDKTSEKIATNIEIQNLEKLTVEVCDNLINNPGEPKTWEKLDSTYNIVPGLSILNSDNKTIANSISYDKLLKLKDSYESLVDKKLFKNQIKSSMALYPLNSSIPPILLGSPDSGKNIVSVNRIVKCDFYLKYIIKDFKGEINCNQNHGDNFTCSYFKLYRSYLKNTDYYLLVDENNVNNNLYWTIDNTMTNNNSYTLIKDNKIYLNNILNDKLDKSYDSIFFIHFKKKKEDIKVVLVGVPKDLDKNCLNYDYFTQTNCRFILKAWY